MKVRITFKKTGVMRYISHLDLQRAFTRALVRSGLDITYSEGFNPHPKIAFAIPLSMYQESICEVVDFGVNTQLDTDLIASSLAAALPKGVEITDCFYPTDKISDVLSADYEITLHTKRSASDIGALMQGRLVTVKSGKKGEVAVDITDKVFDFECFDTDGGVMLKVRVSAAPDAVLNPALICKAIGEDDYDILRTAINFKN